MVNISPQAAGGPVTDDPSWLYSDHGINENLTATLDISLFTPETHFPDGFIPSGTPLAKQTSSGKYGPFTSGGSGGLQTLVGFLYAPLEVTNDLGSAASVVGAVLTHGTVVEANLPQTITAGAKSATPRVQYI